VIYIIYLDASDYPAREIGQIFEIGKKYRKKITRPEN
tara:strand:+ start:131 stop:241 length:111 start_codon:yes stop_codon:yes gene_type:complete